KQCLLAAAVKILRGPQNTTLRIGRQPAEKAQQCPSADSAREIESDIAADHRQQSYAEHEVEMQTSVGSHRASGQEGEGGRQRQTDGFRKAHYRQKQVAMVRNQ